MKAGGAVSAKPKTAKPAKDSDTVALEHDLANMLGLKVEIQDKGGRGQVVIRYETLEQLDGILARLTHGVGSDEV